MKVTPQVLRLRVSWSLDLKIEYACKKISEFVIYFKGQCFQSFSGGKDSKIVRDIIDKIWDGTYKHITPSWERVVSYPKPVSLFSNTGLEFPEIVKYVNEHDNVVIVKPKMGFTRVIKEYGFAIGSKKVAEMVSRLKKYIANPSPKNEATRRLYQTGIKKDGTKGASSSKLAKRWLKLLQPNAPMVSEKCCDILKKEPFYRYANETGKFPIVGTRVAESDRRTTSYYITGCNSFDEGNERCRPISIFTDADIWEYANRWNIRFAEVYYDRVIPVEQIDGSVVMTDVKAESTTGCMWCQFGLHLESKN